MSGTDRALQPETPEAEQSPRREHGPRALEDRDLLPLVKLQPARFYALKALGAFRFLELRPQVQGMSTRYSPALVDRWLAGEDVSAPATRSFFGEKSAAAVERQPSRRGRRPGRKGGAQQTVAMFDRASDIRHEPQSGTAEASTATQRR
jgi:hypothetical protein